jgi:multicomponent Na+:H+ antiporter subunit D
VNFALLAERIPELPTGTRLGIGLWFLVVFGTKAAVFPLFSWLPDSYPTAPTSITAVFAGLLTKIGVFVIIRFYTLMEFEELGTLLLVVAGLTMIIGVAGALAQDDVKRILSFHVVSQIGYMIMGLGFFTVAGVAGAVLFLVHQIPVKTVMFLAGGLIEDDQGTSALNKVGGLATSRPVIAVLFALPALSLAGLPPFSGFVAKLALVDAGVSAGAYVIVAVSLVGSILTLLSMTKIWIGAFWGDVTPSAVPPSSRRSVTIMQSAAAVAVAGTIAIAVFAGPIWDLCEQIGAELLDPSTYVSAVLG